MKKPSFVLSLLVTIAAFAPGQSRIAETLKGESWIAYRMVHPLHVIDAKSTNAEYKLELDPAKKEIKMVTAQVDVTTFDSGNSNRDSHAMEVNDAITYPDVEFTSTSIVQKGDSLFVTGKLTFHGVTKDITMASTTQWQANRLDVHGAFDIGLTEFKIDRPSLLMIPVEDKLSFTLAAAFAWK
jgi:polyisoprenoid-binding protein YceI